LETFPDYCMAGASVARERERESKVVETDRQRERDG
jgi:hypothetical protein